MTTNSKARDSAEANFKKRQRAQVEGAKAMAEYHAEAIATRERTVKLRQARLAAEAARQKLEESQPKIVKAPRKKKPAGPAVAGAGVSKPLVSKPPVSKRLASKPAKPRTAKPNGG